MASMRDVVERLLDKVKGGPEDVRAELLRAADGGPDQVLRQFQLLALKLTQDARALASRLDQEMGS